MLYKTSGKRKENIRKNIWNLWQGRVLRLEIKIMIHKREKLDFLQIKNFCSAEDLVKRMKRPGTIWKKIFASYISNIDQHLKYVKSCQNSAVTNKQPPQKNTFRLWWKDKHFTKEDIQIFMSNKYMRRCSLLAIREMQV